MSIDISACDMVNLGGVVMRLAALCKFARDRTISGLSRANLCCDLGMAFTRHENDPLWPCEE